MRLDYTLYVLAALLLIITAVPFIAPIGVETTETKSLWVVATVVMGLLSIGLGYSQRPKTEAQACQPSMTTAPEPQETMPQTQPAAVVEAPKEETVAPAEKAAIAKKATDVASPAVATMALTQVKGVGEKRAVQLAALGINSVEDLSKASSAAVAKKLKVSPKIVDSWIANAKKIVK